MELSDTQKDELDDALDCLVRFVKYPEEWTDDELVELLQDCGYGESEDDYSFFNLAVVLFRLTEHKL